MAAWCLVVVLQGEFFFVNKVTPSTVRTVAKVIESATSLRLVLGVPVQTAQFRLPMGKLALASVFATAVFLKATAQFGFVAVGGEDCRVVKRWKARRGRHFVGLHFAKREGTSFCQTHGAVGPGRKLFAGQSFTPNVQRPAGSSQVFGAGAKFLGNRGVE